MVAPGVEVGWEIAQRMSIVITHWPVVRSHWRIVLSEAPVTYKKDIQSTALLSGESTHTKHSSSK